MPVVGWKGTYLIGRWTDLTMDFDAKESGDYDVRVTAPDPDGHRVVYSSKTKLTAGHHRLRGFFKVGQSEPEIEAAVISPSGQRGASWKSRPKAIVPLDPSVHLIVTVGNPPGFEWAEATEKPVFRTIAAEVQDLPTTARGYDSVSLLVIAGPSVLSAEQAAAVHDWVVAGGRVAISLPPDPTVARQVVQPFDSWFPATIAPAAVTVSEFGKLESYAGKNVRIPFVGRMPIPGVKINQGEVLAGSRDEALLVRSACGLGTVTVLALDVTKPPLSKWTELPTLCRRLAETPETLASGNVSRSLQLSSTGITDLASQLHASQEDFAKVHRASPWFVMGLMILFLLVIGPLDYVIVHRLLKWPRGTWITLPIWVCLSAALSANLARAWNGDSFRINQLNLVNVDVDTSTCHQRLWTNVYCPATERRSVTIHSRIAAEDSKALQQAGWSGIAETAFGGMLRTGSVHVGLTEYAQPEGASIEDLPMLQWSSKALLAEVHSKADGLVESDLQSNGVGQLSGTLTHRLPGPIEDWFLAYGQRIYRHKKSRDDQQAIPLAARQVLRIDQPNIYPRELRAFLTGKVVTGVQKQGSQASDVASQFTSYDSMSRNPADALKILTFHHEVGGVKYTGLTNRLLENEDLTHLLKLGRAVLFGRLNSPVASVTLNGAEITPDRETTFIRIVLPVKKVNTDVRRTLERLDD